MISNKRLSALDDLLKNPLIRKYDLIAISEDLIYEIRRLKADYKRLRVENERLNRLSDGLIKVVIESGPEGTDSWIEIGQWVCKWYEGDP